MNRFFIVVMLAFLSINHAFSQSEFIDSLRNSFYNLPAHDTTKAELAAKISLAVWTYDLDSAQIFANKAQELIDKHPNCYHPRRYTFNALGWLAFLNNQPYHAFLNYKQSEELSITFHDSTSLNDTYQNIATVYRYIGDTDKTIEYLQKTLDCAFDDFGRFSALMDIGIEKFYNKEKLPQQGLEYFQKLYDEARPKLSSFPDGEHFQNEHFLLTNILCSLAIFELENSRFHEALQHCYQADNYFQKHPEYEPYQIQNWLHLAEAHVGLNHPDSAKFYLNKVDDYDQNYDYNFYIEQFKIRSKLAYLMHDFKKAFDFSEKYHSIKDSLRQHQNSDEAAQMRFWAQSELQSAELKIEQQRSKFRSYLITAAAIIILLITLYSLRLARQASRLKKINATKDRLFSIVSHDIRGPIGMMVPLFHSLSKGTIPSEQTAFFLDMAYNRIKSTYAMMDNLLWWARSQQDTIALNITKLSLGEISSDIMQTIKGFAEDRRVQLNTSLPRENDFLLADKDLLKIILLNLLTNAIKFTPQNGIVTFDCQPNQKFFRFTITDSGNGMSEEKIKSLFSITTNVSTPDAQNEKSTGIGLLLVHDFLHKHGAALEISSKLGQGSSFSFLLPRA